MKRLILVLLLFLLINLFGCSQDNYQIKIIDFSDSILGAKQKVETTELENKIYVDGKEEKHQTVKTNLGEIEAEYVSTQKILYQYFEVKEYKDVDGNTFRVNQFEQITHYFWFENNNKSEERIDATQALIIANDFIEKFNNPGDYKISVDFKEDTLKYIVQYTKYIGNLKTSDQATIKIDLFGNLYSFTSSFFGMISKDSKVEFDFDEISTCIMKRLNEIYSDAKTKYDDVSYDLTNVILLPLDENNSGLIYSVEITCKNKAGDYEQITSGMTLFLVKNNK